MDGTMDKTSFGLSFVSKTENTKERSYILEEEQDALPEEEEETQLSASAPEVPSLRPHLLSHRQMVKILKHEKAR